MERASVYLLVILSQVVFFITPVHASLNLPAPEQIQVQTFKNSALSKDATKAGMMQRMMSQLDAIAQTRALTPDEKAKHQAYKMNVAVIYRDYQKKYFKTDKHNLYQDFLNEAATVQLRTGDNWIKRVAPELLAEYQNIAPRQPNMPVTTTPVQSVSHQSVSHSTKSFLGGLLVGLFWLCIWGGAAALFWFWYKSYRPVSWDILNQEDMEKFGATKEERDQNIRVFFDNPMSTLNFFIDDSNPRIRAMFERNLMTMERFDKELLKGLYLMYNEGFQLSGNNFYLARFALINGHNQGQLLSKGRNGVANINNNQHGLDVISAFSRSNGVTAESIKSFIFRELNNALQKQPDNPVLKEIFETFTEVSQKQNTLTSGDDENIVEFEIPEKA